MYLVMAILILSSGLAVSMDPQNITDNDLFKLVRRRGNAQTLYDIGSQGHDFSLVVRPETGTTLLHDAAWYGDAQTVAAVAHFSNINAQDYEGETALFLAVQQAKHEIISLLLEMNADPNIQAEIDEYLNQTPLHYAIADNHDAQAVRLLIPYSDLSAVDSDGNTALHLAVVHALPDVVEALIYANADCSSIDIDDVGSALSEDFISHYLQETTELIDRTRSIVADPAQVLLKKFAGNRTVAQRVMERKLGNPKWLR